MPIDGLLEIMEFKVFRGSEDFPFPGTAREAQRSNFGTCGYIIPTSYRQRRLGALHDPIAGECIEGPSINQID